MVSVEIISRIFAPGSGEVLIIAQIDKLKIQIILKETLCHT